MHYTYLLNHACIYYGRCDGFYKLTVTGRMPHTIQRFHSYERDDSKKYGYLDVPDGDIIAYATQASEAVYLITLEIEAEVLRDNYNHIENRMYICMDASCWIPNYCGEVEVQFEVKHSCFDNLHNVLNCLPIEVVRQLLPQSEDFDGIVRPEGIAALYNVPREYRQILHLNEMSPDRMLTYQVALSCKSGSPPVLISGAFGTGKTCFLSSLAYCFISEVDRTHVPARVLICAHHQATADNILHAYFGPMLEHEYLPLKAKVIRITSKHYRPSNEMYQQWYTPINEVVHIYAKTQKLVVITTFLTTLNLQGLYPPGFFTHILIDEGSQAREPETVAPLCLADRETKIIVAGDSHQVIVTCTPYARTVSKQIIYF